MSVWMYDKPSRDCTKSQVFWDGRLLLNCICQAFNQKKSWMNWSLINIWATILIFINAYWQFCYSRSKSRRCWAASRPRHNSTHLSMTKLKYLTRLLQINNRRNRFSSQDSNLKRSLKLENDHPVQTVKYRRNRFSSQD